MVVVNATAVVYYWYQGRGRIVSNEYRVKCNLLRDAALSGRTEEALVRVLVPVRAAGGFSGGSPPEAYAIADSLGAGIAAQLAQAGDQAPPHTNGSASVIGLR
jgi:hypothetical protein